MKSMKAKLPKVTMIVLSLTLCWISSFVNRKFFKGGILEPGGGSSQIGLRDFCCGFTVTGTSFPVNEREEFEGW